MFKSQLHPENLIGTQAEMPPPLTIQKAGILYYQTDSGQTFISVIVAGLMTWQLLASGGSASAGVLLRARLGSIANLPLSGLAAVDGVVPVAGDIIGAFGQTVASQNGLYVASAGAWVRATNFDSSAEVLPGSLIVVSEGTTLHGLVFELTTPAPIVLNTTPLTFAQVAGPYQSTSFTGVGPFLINTSDTLVTFNPPDQLLGPNYVANLPPRNTVPNGHEFIFVNFNETGALIDITPVPGDPINGAALLFFTMAGTSTFTSDDASSSWVRS